MKFIAKKSQKFALNDFKGTVLKLEEGEEYNLDGNLKGVKRACELGYLEAVKSEEAKAPAKKRAPKAKPAAKENKELKGAEEDK